MATKRVRLTSPTYEYMNDVPVRFDGDPARRQPPTHIHDDTPSTTRTAVKDLSSSIPFDYANTSAPTWTTPSVRSADEAESSRMTASLGVFPPTTASVDFQTTFQPPNSQSRQSQQISATETSLRPNQGQLRPAADIQPQATAPHHSLVSRQPRLPPVSEILRLYEPLPTFVWPAEDLEDYHIGTEGLPNPTWWSILPPPYVPPPPPPPPPAQPAHVDASSQTEPTPSPSAIFGYTLPPPLPTVLPNFRPMATPVSRKKLRSVNKADCAACLESIEVSKMTSVGCGCRYCDSCLNELFLAGLSSAASFPPKCHGKALRINIYGNALKEETITRYKTVEAEFSSRRPLYCGVPTCSTFINTEEIVEAGEYGICGQCDQATCTSCKMLIGEHTSSNGTRNCPIQPVEARALRCLSMQEAWQDCPSCGMMIEKVEGCDHIECQCGIEFCYICGSLYNERDECDCTGDDISDEDEFDERGDDWPQHRRMLDPLGRSVCTHGDTELVDGDLCHGCLRPSIDGMIRSCITCHVELCDPCLRSLRGQEEEETGTPSTTE